MPAQKRHRKAKSKPAVITPWFDQVTVLNAAHEAEHFVADVLDPDRYRPVVVISLPQDTGVPRVPVDQLVEHLDGSCHIVALGNAQTTWACSSALGDNLKVYGGAVRLLMPGATLDDDPWGHPLFTTPSGGDGAATVRTLVERVRAEGYLDNSPFARLSVVRDTPARTVPPTVPQTVPPTVPQVAAVKAVPVLPGNQADMDLTPEPTDPQTLRPDDTDLADLAPPEPDLGSPATEAALSELALANERLADLEHDRDRLAAAHRDLTRELALANSRRVVAERHTTQARAELADLRTQLAAALAQVNSAEALAARDLNAEWALTVQVAKDERDAALARADRAEIEGARLRKKNKSLTDQVKDLSTRVDGLSAFDSPETQFRHEVWLNWVHEVPEADREGKHAVRPYAIGPDFLDSVKDLEGISRKRIVSAIREIVCGQVWTSNAREARQLRTSAAGNSPSVVRADGAVAWRCNLQTKTASARRLMWWELTDGTVELGRAAVHDDMDLR